MSIKRNTNEYKDKYKYYLSLIYKKCIFLQPLK